MFFFSGKQKCLIWRSTRRTWHLLHTWPLLRAWHFPRAWHLLRTWLLLRAWHQLLAVGLFLSHPFLTSPEPNTPCDAQNNQKWYYTHQPKVDDVLFPVVLQVCIQNNITVPRVEHTMWFWWYLFKLKAFNSPNLYCACSIIRKSAGHGCPPVMHGSHFKLWSLVKLFWKRESGKKRVFLKHQQWIISDCLTM